MMYGSWDSERNGQNVLSFWTIFCPFTQKIKIGKNEKNTYTYYHFTHVYHKWQSYDVWCLRYQARQYFLSFWTIFCTFIPLTTRKIKILNKWINHLEILSLYTCVPQMKIIWCMVPEIWSIWQTKLFVILDCFLPFNSHNNPKNKNFEKIKKISGDIIIYTCAP